MLRKRLVLAIGLCLAYAEAAARMAPRGGGLPTPVAAGSSIPDGLEAAAAASLSLDDIIKLPSYSMARVAC